MDPPELKMSGVHKGAPVTDIARICALIESQQENGNRIFLRDKLIYLSAVNSMSLETVRGLLKMKALSEAIKDGNGH